MNKDKENKSTEETEDLSEETLMLKEEMDELARTFQEELDKAKAQEELYAQTREEELIQELEELEDLDGEADDDFIPEDELCECCGERRRGTKENPDSPYCRICERGLRRYPFELQNVVLVLVVLGFSILACLSFTKHSTVYALSARAQHYEQQKKLTSAEAAYSSAIDEMKELEINGELVYQRAVHNLLVNGRLDDIPQYEEQFHEFELKLPHFKTAKHDFDTYESFRITQYDGYKYLYEQIQIIESTDGDYTKLPYAEICGRLDSLLGKSTEASYKEQDEMAEGAVDSPKYLIKTDHYDESMINFIKFYAAVISDQDTQIQIDYLEKIRQAYPEYTWFYGAMLGDLYNRQKADITELCSYMREINIEDDAPDVIETVATRISGDYAGCIMQAEKHLTENNIYAYELHRQKALCYLMIGEYDNALTSATAALEAEASIQTLDTCALCALAAEDEASFNDIKDYDDTNGIKMSQEVLDFMDGKTDLETILTKGDFDIS